MTQVTIEQRGMTIAGPLACSTVATLRQELLRALSPGEVLRVVWLSEVNEVDAAGVQLLSALVKAYPDVKLCAPSPILREFLVRLGALRLVADAA